MKCGGAGGGNGGGGFTERSAEWEVSVQVN